MVGPHTDKLYELKVLDHGTCSASVSWRFDVLNISRVYSIGEFDEPRWWAVGLQSGVRTVRCVSRLVSDGLGAPREGPSPYIVIRNERPHFRSLHLLFQVLIFDTLWPARRGRVYEHGPPAIVRDYLLVGGKRLYCFSTSGSLITSLFTCTATSIFASLFFSSSSPSPRNIVPCIHITFTHGQT